MNNNNPSLLDRYYNNIANKHKLLSDLKYSATDGSQKDDTNTKDVITLLTDMKTTASNYRAKENNTNSVYTSPAHEEVLKKLSVFHASSSKAVQSSILSDLQVSLVDADTIYQNATKNWQATQILNKEKDTASQVSELIDGTNFSNLLVPNTMLKNISKTCDVYYDIYTKFNLFNTLKTKARTAFNELILEITHVSSSEENERLTKNVNHRILHILKNSGFDSIADFISMAFQQYVFLGSCFIYYDKENKLVQLMDQNHMYIGYSYENYIQPKISHVFYRPIHFELIRDLYRKCSYTHLRSDNNMEWGLPSYMLNSTNFTPSNNNQNMYYVLPAEDVIILRNEPMRRHNLNFESPLHYLIDDLTSYLNVINIRKATRNSAFSDIHIVGMTDSAQWVKGVTVPGMAKHILERGNILSESTAKRLKETGLGKNQTVVVQGVDEVHTLDRNYEMRRQLNIEISDFENSILANIGVQSGSVDPNVTSGNPNNAGKGSLDSQNLSTLRFIYSFAKLIKPVFETITSDILLNKDNNITCGDVKFTHSVKDVIDTQSYINNIDIRFRPDIPLTPGEEAKYINNYITLYTVGAITIGELRNFIKLTAIDVQSQEWLYGNKLLSEAKLFADNNLVPPKIGTSEPSAAMFDNNNGNNKGGKPPGQNK